MSEWECAELRAGLAAGICLLAVSLLLFLPPAGGGTTSTGRVIRVRGTIQTIAIDGPRLVYDRFVPAANCNKLFVFDLVGGRSRAVSGCFSYISTTRYLGVAGRQIAWIDEAGDPSGYDRSLWVTSLTRRKPHRLATASCNGDLDTGGPCVGTWISSLVGSGSLLAVNRGATNEHGDNMRSGLDEIGQRGLRRIVSGAKATYAQAADSGRIAVLRANGTIGVYGGGGKFLLQVRPSSVADEQLDGDAIELRGHYLVVVTRTRRLEVYNSYSGARLHSWPVGKGATNLAADAGIAAYAASAGGAMPYKVHVVGLATGKDVVLGTGKWFTDQRDVVLGSAGLVYLRDRQTLVYIPLSRVLAAVS